MERIISPQMKGATVGALVERDGVLFVKPLESEVSMRQITEEEYQGLQNLLRAARRYRKESLQERPDWLAAHNALLDAVMVLDPTVKPYRIWDPTV